MPLKKIKVGICRGFKNLALPPQIPDEELKSCDVNTFWGFVAVPQSLGCYHLGIFFLSQNFLLNSLLAVHLNIERFVRKENMLFKLFHLHEKTLLFGFQFCSQHSLEKKRSISRLLKDSMTFQRLPRKTENVSPPYFIPESQMQSYRIVFVSMQWGAVWFSQERVGQK